MSIKVGDKVRALEGCSFSLLAEGLTYKVVAISKYYYGVRIGGEVIYYLKDKFEKVTEPSLSVLRSEAFKAYDAGLLSSVECYKDFITGQDVVQCVKPSKYMRQFIEDTVEEGLRYLQSLYTTEFKIETEEDLSRVSKGAKGVLANGNEFEVLAPGACTVRGGGLLVGYTLGYNARLYMDELKGATITQSTDN